jgi:hypothetical protein
MISPVYGNGHGGTLGGVGFFFDRALLAHIVCLQWKSKNGTDPILRIGRFGNQFQVANSLTD